MMCQLLVLFSLSFVFAPVWSRKRKYVSCAKAGLLPTARVKKSEHTARPQCLETTPAAVAIGDPDTMFGGLVDPHQSTIHPLLTRRRRLEGGLHGAVSLDLRCDLIPVYAAGPGQPTIRCVALPWWESHRPSGSSPTGLARAVWLARGQSCCPVRRSPGPSPPTGGRSSSCIAPLPSTPLCRTRRRRSSRTRWSCRRPGYARSCCSPCAGLSAVVVNRAPTALMMPMSCVTRPPTCPHHR